MFGDSEYICVLIFMQYIFESTFKNKFINDANRKTSFDMYNIQYTIYIAESSCASNPFIKYV